MAPAPPPTSRSRPPPWTPALLPRPGPRAPVGGAKAPLSPACAHAPELQPPRHRARQPAHAHARVGARRHIVFAQGTGQRRIRGPAQQRMQIRRLTSHDRASRAAAASSMSFSSSAFLASSMTTRSARCDKSVMCSASTCRRPHALNTGMRASSAHEHQHPLRTVAAQLQANDGYCLARVRVDAHALRRASTLDCVIAARAS